MRENRILQSLLAGLIGLSLGLGGALAATYDKPTREELRREVAEEVAEVREHILEMRTQFQHRVSELNREDDALMEKIDDALGRLSRIEGKLDIVLRKLR